MNHLLDDSHEILNLIFKTKNNNTNLSPIQVSGGTLKDGLNIEDMYQNISD